MITKNTQVGTLQIVLIDHPVYGEMQVRIDVNGKVELITNDKYTTELDNEFNRVVKVGRYSSERE